MFEIGLEDSAAFKDFIDANYELIKHHLLAVKGEMSEEIRLFLEERELKYVCNMELPLPKRNLQEFVIPVAQSGESGETPREQEGEGEPPVPEVEQQVEPEESPEEESPEVEEAEHPEALQIVMTALRSGQYIEHNGDVLLTERVNSGAKIAALGSVVALGRMEGDISAAGECIIVTPVTKGNILFHGRRIEGEQLTHPLNLIKFSGDRITIKPIIKRSSIE